MANKVILHIDINSFFVSCHQIIEPKFKNKPVVVCRNRVKGVVVAASYPAKSYGITAGMPIFKALRLLPSLIVIKPAPALYQQKSQDFFNYLKKNLSLQIEVASIDECYVDLTPFVSPQNTVLSIAQKLQQKIFYKLQLPTSIGIAENKFCAKMASNMRKPLGITILKKTNLKTKLWPLSIEKMHGIGKNLSKIFLQNGIKTIGQLAHYKCDQITYDNKTINIKDLKNLAQGNSSDEIQSIRNQAQSIGRQHSFLQPNNSYQEIRNVILKLLVDVAARAQKAKLFGRALEIVFTYKKGSTIHRQKQILNLTNNYQILKNHFLDLFENYWTQEPLKLIGISLKKLVFWTDYYVQLMWHEFKADEFDANSNHDERIIKIIRKINDKIETQSVFLASDLF